MSDEPAYVCLDTIKPETPNWYWRNLLGENMLTMLDGDPGVGKSYLAMKLAAEFSRGGTLPGNPHALKPSRVFYLSGEDDPSFTIRPRIEAMGGDPSKIFVQGNFSPFDEKGMASLKNAIRASPAKLVIIDPLYSFAGAEADIYRPNEIRRVLTKLIAVTSYSGAAVLAIRHLRKLRADKAIYQGAGVIDVIGFARCGLLVAEDPDDPALKVIAHSKYNLSKRMESMTYRLIDEGDDKLPTFEWAGVSLRTADELAGGKEEGAAPRNLAKEFLRRALANGEQAAREVLELAEHQGISKRTLNRAKQEMGVESRSTRDGWFWKLG